MSVAWNDRRIEEIARDLAEGSTRFSVGDDALYEIVEERDADGEVVHDEAQPVDHMLAIRAYARALEIRGEADDSNDEPLFEVAHRGALDAIAAALGVTGSRDAAREELRSLSVDECDGCGPRGLYVRYCPIHGLQGVAPR